MNIAPDEVSLVVPVVVDDAVVPVVVDDAVVPAVVTGAVVPVSAVVPVVLVVTGPNSETGSVQPASNPRTQMNRTVS
jgi:hypothetical protein